MECDKRSTLFTTEDSKLIHFYCKTRAHQPTDTWKFSIVVVAIGFATYGRFGSSRGEVDCDDCLDGPRTWVVAFRQTRPCSRRRRSPLALSCTLQCSIPCRLSWNNAQTQSRGSRACLDPLGCKHRQSRQSPWTCSWARPQWDHAADRYQFARCAGLRCACCEEVASGCGCGIEIEIVIGP